MNLEQMQTIQRVLKNQVDNSLTFAFNATPEERAEQEKIRSALDAISKLIESHIITECAECGKQIEQTRAGRVAEYCGSACKQRAYRNRQNELFSATRERILTETVKMLASGYNPPATLFQAYELAEGASSRAGVRSTWLKLPDPQAKDIAQAVLHTARQAEL